MILYKRNIVTFASVGGLRPERARAPELKDVIQVVIDADDPSRPVSPRLCRLTPSVFRGSANLRPGDVRSCNPRQSDTPCPGPWTDGRNPRHLAAILDRRFGFADLDRGPPPADNLDGYARLADTVDTRIAVGDWGFSTRFEFEEIMDRGQG